MMGWGKHFMSLHLLRSLHTCFYWTNFLHPMTCTRGYLHVDPISYKSFHVINLAFCMHGLEMNHFISFLFTFISFRLWSKPPFKFSLPHPLPSNLAYPHTKMKKESWKEMCVFPKCERLFSLTHTHKKSNQMLSLLSQREETENRKAYLFSPLPLF